MSIQPAMPNPDARRAVALAETSGQTGRWLRAVAPWLAAAVLFLVLPKIFSSGTSITTLSIMGVMIVFALSYNMLLGQTGLLSFGHAVYFGLAGYFTIHAMNAIVAHKYPVPLPVLPVVGGLAGLFFGVLFGTISTRRAGTVFSMISLGLGELVAASALALKTFFGGEAGVSVNRAKLAPFFGYKFGPQVEVYYMVAAWCFVCILLMYAITRTPFGRICNAVRENAERVEFVGYSAQRVRFIAFSLSAFFAGIAGSLAAINFEIVNSQSVGAQQSGFVLLMTFFGGAGSFFGPIIGAVTITLLQLNLSGITAAWMLYFGLLFILVVMYSPGGVAGWLLLHRDVMRAGQLGRLVPSYLLALVPIVMIFVGATALIEFSHRVLTGATGDDAAMQVLGWSIDPAGPVNWAVAALLFGGGIWLLTRVWRHVGEAWGALNLEIRGKAAA